MNFKIDSFQYFNKNLLNEEINLINSLPNNFDLLKIVSDRKKEYLNHSFIVTEGNIIKFIDENIINSVSISIIENNLHINILNNTHLLYWIDISNNANNKIYLNLENLQTIIHEEIIGKKCTNNLIINNKGVFNYFNIVNSYTNQLFYKNLEFYNYGKILCFFMQKEQVNKIKLDVKINLFENASSYIEILNSVQLEQLKDDCFEIHHFEKNTYSYINYQNINAGKAVSQINNIIEKKAINSELIQKIKHILTTEKSESFSKPNLMIYAPTIASHGNSMSSFPEEWLFYLYQKGFSESLAKNTIKNSIIKNFCSLTPYENQFYSYFLGEKNE